VSSTEAYVGDSGISRVHTQTDLVWVAYIREMLCDRTHICGKALGKRKCTWVTT
jgi:hypothetical protein